MLQQKPRRLDAGVRVGVADGAQRGADRTCEIGIVDTRDGDLPGNRDIIVVEESDRADRHIVAGGYHGAWDQGGLLVDLMHAPVAGADAEVLLKADHVLMDR